MVAERKPNRMSEAEYIAFAEGYNPEAEQNGIIRWEYRAGEIISMVGGTVNHSIITANVSRHLGNKLDKKDCTVTSPDVRVHIMQKRSYRYADVTVFCGAPEYHAERTDIITNPVVLVEVLSPSTQLMDRNEKLEEYTSIPSLQAYLLVAQHEPKIEIFLRSSGVQWLYQFVRGLGAKIEIPPLEVTLTMTDLYHKVR